MNLVRDWFPDVPIMALTATATHRVRRDVLNILKINDAKLFQSSFNRPNLFYTVKKKNKSVVSVYFLYLQTNLFIVEQMMDDIEKIVKDNNRASGIVYCFARNDCEKTAKDLQVADSQFQLSSQLHEVLTGSRHFGSCLSCRTHNYRKNTGARSLGARCRACDLCHGVI